MPSTRIGRSALALALALASLVSAAVPGGMAGAAGSTSLATLLVLSGSVMVSGGSGAAPATDGQTVQLGDEIWTGPNGIALLTFFDGSETQLQADTHIALEVPAGATPGTGVSVFQSAGTTLTHVQHLAPNASFQTNTPAAVALVRGTTYIVTVMPESEAALESEAADASPGGATDSSPDAMADAMPTTAADAISTAAADSGAAAAADTMPATVGTADPPADDETDQLAALFAAAPLIATATDAGATAVPHSCERDKPSECLASVVLLADADGHVGHVEVGSHIAGHPTLHLTAHGDAAHVSRSGASRQVIQGQHLKQLHVAATHLHDVQQAHKAHAVARHVTRAAHRPKPPTPKPHP